MANELILVINPGSTSTKVALFRENKALSSKIIAHSKEELSNFKDINEQLEFRKSAVLEYLKECRVDIKDLSAIAARAGVIGELESGAYIINQDLVDASLRSPAPHPANLSPVIAYEIAKGAGIDAYIYDAVCGCGKPDEIFTITGHKEIKKQFVTHVLNSRAVCIRQSEIDRVNINDTTYIVSHLGGGVTTNLIQAGKILDFVGDDEGAFSPERAGGLPIRALVKLCYKGKYTEKELQTELKGKGGLISYLSVNDLREAEKMIDNGDLYAEKVVDAMILQLSQDIGSLAPIVDGKIDKIILTGGMAYSTRLVDKLRQKVKFIAPVSVMPGTFEMEALAGGILRVLRNEEQVHTFKQKI